MALGELSTPSWLNPSPGWLDSKSSTIGSFMQGYLGGQEAGKERSARETYNKAAEGNAAAVAALETTGVVPPGAGAAARVEPMSGSWMNDLIRGATGIAGGVGGYWNPNIRAQHTENLKRPLEENLIKSQILENDAQAVAYNARAALSVAEAADAATLAAAQAEIAQAKTAEEFDALSGKYGSPQSFRTAKGFDAFRDILGKSQMAESRKADVDAFRKDYQALDADGRTAVGQYWDGLGFPSGQARAELNLQRDRVAAQPKRFTPGTAPEVHKLELLRDAAKARGDEAGAVAYQGDLDKLRNKGEGLTPAEIQREELRSVNADIRKAQDAIVDAKKREESATIKAAKEGARKDAAAAEASLKELRKQKSLILKGVLPGAAASPAAPYDGRVKVVAPDGRVGSVPASQLEQALSNGYKRAD